MFRLVSHTKRVLPGLAVAVLVGFIAVLLARYYQAPAMLFALLLGMALNFLSTQDRYVAGIELASKNVLRVGVALLGLRISFESVAALGMGPIIMVLFLVVLIIAFGIFLTRDKKDGWIFGCLSGGSVAICGASAAMAISSVLPPGPEKEKQTIFTVITVTAFSTIAMVLYPLVADFLDLNATHSGIFLGATIHDVAQVVAAGYGMSDETGDSATIVKLLRVAMLLPVVLGVLLYVRTKSVQVRTDNVKLPFPWFVLGFVLLVGLNSSVELRGEILSFFQDISRTCIVTAVAALGMRTSLKEVAKVGWQPIIVILSETVFLALLCLTLLMVFDL